MSNLKKYIDTFVIVMMFFICGIFAIRGCSFDNSDNYNHQYKNKIDSLYLLNEELRDSIRTSNELINKLKEMERVLYYEISKKEIIISSLKSKRDEKINTINNGSYSESYNRITGRYESK